MVLFHLHGSGASPRAGGDSARALPAGFLAGASPRARGKFRRCRPGGIKPGAFPLLRDGSAGAAARETSMKPPADQVRFRLRLSP